MARIIITGSSGQIGTNLFFRLRENGHEVSGIDKRPNTWTSELPTSLVDMTDPDQVRAFGEEHLEGTDLLVHLAAHAKVYELVVHPERALENINMIFNALELCRQGQVPFVFGSSREVYGDIERIITAETDADFVFAESPYSASKISGEAITSSYSRCYGLPYLVFRFSNVYGRYDNDLDRMVRVIPLFIGQIARSQPITIYGEDKVLDFTYVDDCVEGIVLGIEALLSGAVVDQTFNLAFGKGSTLVELAELIGEEVGQTPDMTLEPSQAGEVTYYVANIGKAKALLGYEPQIPLREGIRRTVQWWRETGRLPAEN